MRFLAFQLAVTDSLGLFVALATKFVLFVFAVGTLKKDDTAIAFEGKNMGADAVKEPTVVTDYNGTAGKVLQTFFQSTKGVDVNIIRRFVEQQDIPLLL